MSRFSIGTPCPAPGPSSFNPLHQDLLGTASIYSTADEDTANIEYTGVFRQDFRRIPPRRGQNFGKKVGNARQATIFEDVVEGQELVLESNRRDVVGHGMSTLLSRPARRLAAQSSVPVVKENAVHNDGELHSSTDIDRPKKRQSMLQTQPGRSVHEDEGEPSAGVEIELKGKPRRRTIFVPSDDTTILTIHPGANTTDRLNDTFYFARGHFQPTENWDPASVDLLHTDYEKREEETRKKRTSLAGAPRRLPLHSVVVNSNEPSVDPPGQTGGKENIPPDHIVRGGEKNFRSSKQAVAAQNGQKIPPARLLAPTAAPQSKQSMVTRKAVPLPRKSPPSRSFQAVGGCTPPGGQTRGVADAPKNMRAKGQSPPAQALPSNASVPGPLGSTCKQAVHSRSLTQRQPLLSRRYPVLSEDLSQPDLYEQSWLSHHETALTELINHIFDSAEPHRQDPAPGGRSIRDLLIEIYHQPHVTDLYKRLQASLSCGALARPKGAEASRLADDLGFRRRFLSLWLDAYEHGPLCAAAEVVAGRQVPRRAAGSVDSIEASEEHLDPFKSRRALAGFLETFFLQIADVQKDRHGAGPCHDVDTWPKMVIRSLMLIWLLDAGKSSGAIHGCLFQPQSQKKSSSAVIHSLAGLLMLSTGDIIRTLRYLEYEASHGQDPLDEVTYRIENIAVDLRDGIFLTHLTELLLFSGGGARQVEGDATFANAMPDRTVLESVPLDGEGRRCQNVLSQHLKMPCIGHAQRMYNVQVALSAIADSSAVPGVVCGGITAEDVVNGHREKTLTLIWSLVSSHGLGLLVDWETLVKDIAGVNPALALPLLPSLGSDLDRDASHAVDAHREELLQQWATAHGERAGVRVTNLTTSFADGKAYGAIIDAFADCMATVPLSRHDNGSPDHLATRLRSLGCSEPFIRQLTSVGESIPSRSTTIANLAFLASRLLPLARRHYAAVTIQRAFRSRSAGVKMGQKTAATGLSMKPANEVESRRQMVSAATTLQRAWRGVIDGRNGRLTAHLAAFQVRARGWIVRRRVMKQRAGVYGRNVGVGRRMGVWGW